MPEIIKIIDRRGRQQKQKQKGTKGVTQTIVNEWDPHDFAMHLS